MADHNRIAKPRAEEEETRKAISFGARLRLLRASPRDLMRLLAYTKPYRTRLTIALVSLFIASGLGLAAPQIVRLLIDAAFVEHNSARLKSQVLTLVALCTG